MGRIILPVISPSGLIRGADTILRVCIADAGELLGEVVSVGAVFAELLHADSVLPDGSPVGLVEDVAWLAAARV